jgi:hypothetical protein
MPTIYELVRAFHVSRRMWFYWQETLILAPEGSPLSHADWLISIFGDDYDTPTRIISESTRGYVLNGDIFCYTGTDMISTLQVEKDAPEVAKLLAPMFSLKGSLFCGIRRPHVQTTNAQWPAEKRLGSIADILGKVK